MDGILGSLGIDPFYVFIVLFVLQIILCVERMERVLKKIF